MNFPKNISHKWHGKGDAPFTSADLQDANGIEYFGRTFLLGRGNVPGSFAQEDFEENFDRPVLLEIDGEILVMPSLSDVDSEYQRGQAAAAASAHDAEQADESMMLLPPSLADTDSEYQRGCRTPFAIPNGWKLD